MDEADRHGRRRADLGRRRRRLRQRDGAGYTSGDLFATQQGDKDIVVATFDPAGAVTLHDQLGTIGNDKGASVALDGAGNTYVSGFSDGNLETNIGNFDAVLVKYGPGLTRLWARQFGTTESDGADPFAEGNVFLATKGRRSGRPASRWAARSPRRRRATATSS